MEPGSRSNFILLCLTTKNKRSVLLYLLVTLKPAVNADDAGKSIHIFRFLLIEGEVNECF